MTMPHDPDGPRAAQILVRLTPALLARLRGAVPAGARMDLINEAIREKLDRMPVSSG